MKFAIEKCNGHFELEGSLKDIIKQASLIQSIPDECPLCQGDIRLDYRKPKGFEYFSLRCTKCSATKNFGIAKEDNSLFLRYDEKFEKYAPKNGTSKPEKNVDNTGQEIPF